MSRVSCVTLAYALTMTDDAGDADRPADEPAHPSQHRGRRRLPWPRLVTALVGLGLLVAGIVTMVVADAQSSVRTAVAEMASVEISDSGSAVAYIGSYEPWMEGELLWLAPDPGVIAGMVLAVVGVAVLVFTLGWWLAARRSNRTAASARSASGRRWCGRSIDVVPAIMAVLGLALIVGGVVVVASTPPVSFGWFAYAPESDTVLLPTPVPPSLLIGQLLVALGTAFLVGVAGWLFGRWATGRTARAHEPVTA